MQVINFETFGGANKSLSNVCNSLKVLSSCDKEVFFEIFHHFGLNKTGLEICTTHQHKYTTGITIFFNLWQEAKEWIERTYQVSVCII